MSILNFQCETAREVPLKELRSGQDLDPLSWQEKFCANYIYIYLNEDWFTNGDAAWKKDPKDSKRLHSKIVVCIKRETGNFFRRRTL